RAANKRSATNVNALRRSVRGACRRHRVAAMKTDLTNPSGFQLARRRRTSDAQRQEVTTARFCETNPNAEHDNDLKLSGGCEGGHSAPLRCAGLGVWTLIPGFPSRPAFLPLRLQQLRRVL